MERKDNATNAATVQVEHLLVSIVSQSRELIAKGKPWDAVVEELERLDESLSFMLDDLLESIA